MRYHVKNVGDLENCPNEAKVLYIAELVYPSYNEDGVLVFDNNDEETEAIRAAVDSSSASEGDILFAGSTYETRQEYGFYIKTKDGYICDNDSAYGGGSQGLIDFAKDKFPEKNYDNALKLVAAFLGEDKLY